MATFIRETNYSTIAKALIFNHDKLWVLLSGNYATSQKDIILSRIRALGIDRESRLYSEIEYSICTKESIKDRSIYYDDSIIIFDVDELVREIVDISCNVDLSCNEKIYVNSVGIE